MATIPYIDPVEQRDRVIDQVKRWHEKHRRKPSHLLRVQIGALLRLVDRLDDIIDDEPHDRRSI
jgi:hypothetical protein